MTRRKRPGKREGYGLPFAVLRGIVRQNRYAPPANRSPRYRVFGAAAAERLSRLDARVWKLPIDWGRHAWELDQCAQQAAVARTYADEKATHSKIARCLRRAGMLLRAEGQLDPALVGVFDVLAQHYGESFKPFVQLGRSPPGAPRLSEFLAATASFVEGEKVLVVGLHRTEDRWDEHLQSVGPDGAALKAADAVRRFFMRHTRGPQNDLMVGIVAAYHPDVAERDWVSTLDKRRQNERNRKRAQKSWRDSED